MAKKKLDYRSLYQTGLLEVRGLLKTAVELVEAKNFDDAITCTEHAVALMRWTKAWKKKSRQE